MNSIKVREYLRRHVLGLVAISIALSGTAVAAGGSQGEGPKASASIVTDAKFKKLKRRVAALEAKPAPVTPTIPTTLPPSGPAGGALTGTYPNPELGTIVTRTNNVNINAGGSDTVSANCAAGERIISGGGVFLIIGLPAETVELTRSIKTGTAASPGNGWQVSAQNDVGVNGVLVAQAYCLQ